MTTGADKPKTAARALKEAFADALQRAYDARQRAQGPEASLWSQGEAAGRLGALVDLAGLVEALDETTWTREDFRRFGATGGAKARHTLTRRQARRMMRARLKKSRFACDRRAERRRARERREAQSTP